MEWRMIIFSVYVLCIYKICANENSCTKEDDSCTTENIHATTSDSDHILNIEIPLGKIKGLYKTSYGGRVYEAFEGIPYALPPTGERRFQPPQSIKSWDHEIDATKEPNNCTQVDYLKKIMVVGDEDCLYLNIYTPRRQGTPPLPVLFWIHGGSYQSGAGTERRAKYIMDRDLILVTINYRLGVYGFLSTGDEVIPGNMGLKDQNLALRWVSENIKYFGGDPKRITLAGESAGGSSVQFHYLSPMSAGLFQNGISFSGDVLAKWAFTEDPSADTEKFANATNCPFDNSKSLAECLKRKSANEIRDSIDKLLKSQYNSFLINMTVFNPVVEKISDNYFINRHPLEILESGQIYDVPYITGHVSEDGLWSFSGIMLDDKLTSYVDKEWINLAPYLLMYSQTIPKIRHAEVANLSRTHYLDNKSISKDSIREYVNLLSDSNAILWTEKAAKLQAKATKSPVYYYYYTYRAARSFSDYLSRTTTNFGVCHLDDILFFLENEFIDPTTTVEDRAMLKDILDLWYSFINTGKPHLKVDWPRINHSSDNLEYLHIGGPNNFTLHSTNNFREKLFWRRIGFQV